MIIGLLDEYSPLCHHRLQGRIYLLGLQYIHHKKSGYNKSNKEDTSVRKEVKKRTTDCHSFIKSLLGARSGAVVEALSYKLEGHGIDSQWCHWNFSLP
jgi:hypothetical protein